MATRSISQILGELQRYDQPAVNVIDQQLKRLPATFQGQRQGLEQRKDNEFRDITTRANRRGMVYSGAPVQEEQRYTGEQFLPAMAALRGQENEQRSGLASQLAQISRERGLRAQEIRQRELDREYAEQQSRRSAAASGGGGGASGIGDLLNSLLNNNNNNNQTSAATTTKLPKIKGLTDKGWQSAYNDVRARVDNSDKAALQSDYLAAAKSAKYGNLGDLAKLQVYRQLAPDLFKHAYRWENALMKGFSAQPGRLSF